MNNRVESDHTSTKRKEADMRIPPTSRLIVAALSLATFAGAAQAAGQAKNVILMISDGQGFNHAIAAEQYTGSLAPYHSFDVKLGMATFSANNNAVSNPLGYDPAKMATDKNYVNGNATDSASAATAMYTGVKNYDGEVNWTTDDKPLTTYFEKAAATGMSIGAVSSVEFSHATPAAVYGHNSSRNNYAAIGTEGVYGSNPVNDLTNSGTNPKAGDNNNYDSKNYHENLKVLMGAGSGDYNDNGAAADPSDQYVGGTTAWADIKDGAPNGWTLAQSKAEFEAIANGTVASAPDKLLGVAQVATTLQQGRSNPAGNFDPMNTNVPTLETMTKASLNVLAKSDKGFAVMIEGGAVDWAGHANQLDRTIEEQIDFNNSVQAVIDWVNQGGDNNDWSNTLLIVTADHETGWLHGGNNPDSYFDVNGNGQFDLGVDYGHMKDNGAGVLPGGGWWSGGHTNQLVPLFAKGAGAELLEGYIVGTDANLDAYYDLTDNGWTGFDGRYIDNTSIYNVMMQASGVPEPASLGILSVSGLLLLARRRRQA